MESVDDVSGVDTGMPSSDPESPKISKPDPLEGTTIGQDGRYRILQRIGEGGFGTVYMVEQTEPVRRKVAIKVLKAGMDTRQVVARFEAERQALAMMDHPNIAKVHDGGETAQGRPFFVMELVRGTPITAYCNREQLDTEARLQLFLKVCRAVQHAHQKGIIHRDLKPANVLVTVHEGTEPMPKVIDFGVAKALESPLTDKTLFTRFEQMIGTPAYMSPEQAGSDAEVTDIDTKTDIYALGVLLYELLSGSTPFEASTLQHAAFDEVRRILREEEAPRPSARLSSIDAERRTSIASERGTEVPALGKALRGDLDWIVMKAIEKDRRRRYETANALAEDINRHLHHEPVNAGPPTAAYRTAKYFHRNKATILVATTIVLLLIAGTAVSTWKAIEATKEKERAVEAEQLAEERREEAEVISTFLKSMFESTKPGKKKGGRTITVAESLKLAEQKLEESKDLSIERRAVLLRTIGVVYQSLGLYQEALELLEKTVPMFEEAFGPDHLQTSEAIANLAGSYVHHYRWEEAEELYERVLSIRQRKKGSEYYSNMRNLATIYFQTGRREEAQALREQVLTHVQRKGIDEAVKFAAMMDLAQSYQKSDRTKESRELREKTLAMSKRLFGDEHPHTLSAMETLADSLNESGEWDNGFKMREDAMAIRIKVQGEGHPETMMSMHLLAFCYYEGNRFDDAHSMFERVYTLRSDILGAEHPTTLNTMSFLGDAYRKLGRHQDALELQEQLVSHRKKMAGPTHRQTLLEMNNLGFFYSEMSDFDSAIGILEDGLRKCEEILGENESLSLLTLNNLAASYGANGDLEKGVELYNILLDRLPKNSNEFNVRGTLGKYLKELGRDDEALEVFPYSPTALNSESPAIVASIVPSTSEWKWLHSANGNDPATEDPKFHSAFYQPSFDDSKWNKGKDSSGVEGGFGYGEANFNGVDIGTPPRKGLSKTAYFRHRFTTDQEFNNLEFRCQRDDGIIVYLDGVEIARDNMQAGDEAYLLPANWTISDSDETTVFLYELEDLTLPIGEHVLAISLHNTEAPSSDLRIGEISLVSVEDSQSESEAK